jgi:hypothetical protein
MSHSSDSPSPFKNKNSMDLQGQAFMWLHPCFVHGRSNSCQWYVLIYYEWLPSLAIHEQKKVALDQPKIK